MEDDHFIQPVQKSGLNTVLFRLESCRFVRSVVGDCAKSHHRLAFDQLGTYVGSHDDNRVSEIDRLAEAVGDFALFQNLKQEMHDIRMSLFYLIEEHNRVGAPSNSFEERTAFFST